MTTIDPADEAYGDLLDDDLRTWIAQGDYEKVDKMFGGLPTEVIPGVLDRLEAEAEEMTSVSNSLKTSWYRWNAATQEQRDEAVDDGVVWTDV